MIPPGPSSQARSDAPQSITVTLPESTAADPNPTASVPARPPRQGMDIVDRSIGEFDAERGASDGAGPSRITKTAKAAPRRAGTGATDQASQAQGTVGVARADAQAGVDEQTAPNNRRSRQPRTAGNRTALARNENPAQPLLFGRVTRASFALARLQTPATVTRGVRLVPPAAKPVDPVLRPGEVSGRGIAQVADLGRGSPTYGAAPEVFASSDEPARTAAQACKPRPSARHLAQARGKHARATACS